MTTLAPPPPRTGLTFACLDDDDSGLCHIIVRDRLLCGGRAADDSPGVHRGGTDSDHYCTGCGRPRCPDCERLSKG